MPGSVRPYTDERAGLLAYLARQRLGLRPVVHARTDDRPRLADGETDPGAQEVVEEARFDKGAVRAAVEPQTSTT